MLWAVPKIPNDNHYEGGMIETISITTSVSVDYFALFVMTDVIFGITLI